METVEKFAVMLVAKVAEISVVVRMAVVVVFELFWQDINLILRIWEESCIVLEYLFLLV